MSDRYTVHCPKCGRFVTTAIATANYDGLQDVRAMCKEHGSVEPQRFFDSEYEPWSYEDFFHE